MTWDEREKQLSKEDNFLLGIDNSVSRQFEVFKNRFQKHRSPISYLLSSKVKDMYTYLDGVGKTIFNQYILDGVNEKLNSDGMRATLTMDAKGSTYTLQIFKGSRHLLDWTPLLDKVTVPDFDKALALTKDLAKTRESLNELKEEMLITEVWVNKPSSLFDNGLRSLYIYSIFRPRKFKRDMERLLEELRQDRDKLEDEVSRIKSNINILTDDSDLLRALGKLKVYFMYFPRVEKFSDYLGEG